jgi:hypothetical protein
MSSTRPPSGRRIAIASFVGTAIDGTAAALVFGTVFFEGGQLTRATMLASPSRSTWWSTSSAPNAARNSPAGARNGPGPSSTSDSTVTTSSPPGASRAASSW